MQTMSDKEFDELFREKFDSYRPEPSPLVWEGISAQLQQKNKAAFPLYRVVAACFLVALGTSVFFLNDKEPIKLYGNVKTAEVVSDPVAENADRLVETDDKSADKLSSVNRKEAVVVNSMKKAPSESNTDDTDIETASLAKEQEISLSKSFHNLEKAKSIDTVKSLTETQETFLAINTLPEETVSLEDNVPHRQKIKTMADIVNFVVAKVDKRENKIIEFSKEDDGDIVSGLNLGLVQFRTKNK